MKVLIVEPFFAGSHREWAEGIQAFSHHEVNILSLEGRYWKWRMRGGAVLLAERYLGEGHEPELILGSSMLDLPTFTGWVAKGDGLIPPVVLYCHENQLLYPVPDERPVFQEQRNSFGSINWRSSLLADLNVFNSEFHRKEALNAYQDLIKRAPDHREAFMVERIRERCRVYPPAPDLLALDRECSASVQKGRGMALLWNHRWEKEKGPAGFASIVRTLMEEGYPLDLILAGPSGNEERIRQGLMMDFPEHVIWCGQTKDRDEYLACLRAADLILVTSEQDFFGLSTVEAMHQRTIPILPDRLAYPEHLSRRLQELLYKNEEEAKERMRSLLKGSLQVDGEEVRRSVAGYDIREWIGDFDRLLGSLKDTGKS